MLKFFVAAVLLQLVSSQAINYCDPTLCRAGVINIGCNNDGVSLLLIDKPNRIIYCFFFTNLGLCINLSLTNSN